MNSIAVKDLMIPIDEYATVSKEATLYEAVEALQKAQKEFGIPKGRHRAVLILDENKKVVGLVGLLDILMALEPKYEQVGDSKYMSHFGFNPQFLKTMLKQFDLWNKPLDYICKKAKDLKVKKFMSTPIGKECINEDASLNEAINQLVMGHHQGLIVTRGEEFVGVLRLTDVFDEVAQRITACEI